MIINIILSLFFIDNLCDIGVRIVSIGCDGGMIVVYFVAYLLIFIFIFCGICDNIFNFCLV